MPPKNMVTPPYLKQILSGEKKLMKVSDIKHCNPPRYDEITVVQLYDTCVQMPRMAQYFPDTYPKGRGCNRDYFFTILATIHPEYVDKLLKNCKEVRFATEENENDGDAIDLDPKWEEEFKAFPQFTGK